MKLYRTVEHEESAASVELAARPIRRGWPWGRISVEGTSFDAKNG
jgi:hypothetical protein